MNDDFLHRIRALPPPGFVAGLKARLNRLEQETFKRQPVPRGLFLGGLIAGAALATGLFIAQRMYRPPSDGTRPVPAANPSRTDVRQPPGSTRNSPDSSESHVENTTQGKAGGSNRILGQLSVGASVSIYPSMTEATRFMNKNMNVYPQFSEPTFSLMSASAAFASLCAGGDTLDVIVVDRRILPEELDACHRLTKRVREVKLGYEAVVLARSQLYGAPNLSTRSIFLALAREIPDSLHPEELIKNPNVTWDQVDSSLPGERIDVTGPPLSSATGVAFRDLILKAGCLTLPTIASLKDTDPRRFEEVCGSIRVDGAYRVRDLFDSSQRAGSNPFDLVGYLQANPEAMALLAYREENLRSWHLATVAIDGVTPSPSMIYSGAYPGARALYLYPNMAVPHIRDFIYAIGSSMGGVSGNTALMSIDASEQNRLRQEITKILTGREEDI